MDKPQKNPMEITLTNWGAGVCGLAMAFLIYHWSDWYSALAVLLGGLVGWLLGVLLSPFKPEEAMFASYGKSIAAFATGFLVSKVDRIFELMMTKQVDGLPIILSAEIWRPFAFAACGLILVMIYTFTSRQYGQRAERNAVSRP